MLNDSSQEEVSIRDIRILPNLNASYLPMMPDGSVLLVDNVWYITKNIDMYMQICMHIYYCYIPYMNVLRHLVVILVLLPLQPRVG